MVWEWFEKNKAGKGRREGWRGRGLKDIKLKVGYGRWGRRQGHNNKCGKVGKLFVGALLCPPGNVDLIAELPGVLARFSLAWIGLNVLWRSRPPQLFHEHNFTCARPTTDNSGCEGFEGGGSNALGMRIIKGESRVLHSCWNVFEPLVLST